MSPGAFQAGGAPAQREWFTTTHWSVVLKAADTASPAAKEALETLCRNYWYPLYAYVRRQGHGPEDAQDLTQEFFARLLERKDLQRADPGRGKFRSFLVVSLKHFLANEWHRTHTVKRGGQYSMISWDAERVEQRYQREPFHEQTPEKLYDRVWAASLLDQVHQQLRAEYAAAGKGGLFEALQVYLSGETDSSRYADFAAQHEMTESAVKMAVLRLRRRFSALLRELIAQTVSGQGEVEEEMRDLLSALRS